MLRTTLMLLLLAAPLAAWAENRDQLVKQYSDFAGSDANSRSLVDGLRDGKEVKLTDGKTTTTFTPPTGKMGNGNVKIALAIEMTKLLQDRADHQGWGKIAQERGFKVGDLMRADKPERQARADKVERPEKPEHPEHPDRSGRGPR
jgi:hypothetical protein